MKTTIILILAAMMAMPMTIAASEISESSTLTDKKPSKKKGEIKSVVFSVYLHCDSCVEKVQENIAFEKGVKDLKVSLENQTVALKYDSKKTNEETLKAAIEELGYPVSGKVDPQNAHQHDHQHKPGEHQHDHQHNH